MTYWKGRKSKQLHKKQQLSRYQLIHRYYDKYRHLLSIGFTEKQALKHLQYDSSMGSLPKLQHRVGIAQYTVGTVGVSLENIRLTKDVRDYINQLESGGIIFPYKKGQTTLKLTKPKVWNA